MPRVLKRLLARRSVRDGLAVALAALVVMSPAIFTDNGFMDDWTNALWFVWLQQHAISSHLVPTYFVHANGLGVFYPMFMFYGGTLYGSVGALAALLGGHVVVAYVGSMVIAVAAAYGGLLWLARELGVRSWMAHVPGITFVASAYYVSDLYGRGDYSEWIAASTIPLILASGWRLARSPRLEPVPAVLFVLSVVFFSGSHNLTLLLGSVIAVVALAGLRLAVGRRLSTVSARRSLAIGAVFAGAVAVNGWFLVPDAAYGQRTHIATYGLFQWSLTGPYNALGMLLSPFRPRLLPPNSVTPGLFVQAPMWFLAWGLVAAAVLWRREPWHLRRATLVLVGLLVALLAAITIEPLWEALPLHGVIQFPWRVNMYVALDVAALVLVTVLSLERYGNAAPARRLRAGLAAATAISIGLCLWQLWVPNTRFVVPVGSSYVHRSQALQSVHVPPKSFYAFGDYNDNSAPLIPATASVEIDPAALDGNKATVTLDPPDGLTPFVTNIAGGPYAVRIVGGITAIGRNATGFVVAERTNPFSHGPVAVSISRTDTAAIGLGRMISMLAVAILCGAFAVMLWRRHRDGGLRQRGAWIGDDPDRRRVDEAVPCDPA
jgi:hypothetical protein